MNAISTDFNKVTVIEGGIAVIEGEHGVEIDHSKANITFDIIEKEISGDYGIIINRKKDYSVIPHEIYDVMNKRKRLRAVAMVAYRTETRLSAEIEKALYKGLFKLFHNLSEATDWIRNSTK